MWLMRYCGILTFSSACVVAMPGGRDGTDGVVEMDGFLGGMCLFLSLARTATVGRFGVTSSKTAGREPQLTSTDRASDAEGLRLMDKRQVGCDENRQGSAAGSPPNFVFSDSLRLKRVWWGVALAFDTTFDLVGQPTSLCQLDFACWQGQAGRMADRKRSGRVDTKLTERWHSEEGAVLVTCFVGGSGWAFRRANVHRWASVPSQAGRRAKGVGSGNEGLA